MPTTPFMGVRISWLMFARNSALMRADSMATSRARCSSLRPISRSAVRSAMPHISRTLRWIAAISTTSSKITHPACSTQRHGLAKKTP